MREKLADLKNTRKTYTAFFERYGVRKLFGKFEALTLLFSDIKNSDNELMSQHIWLNSNKSFEKINFVRGDIVQFEARVIEYEKGYRRYKGNDPKLKQYVIKDFKLAYPSKVKVLKKYHAVHIEPINAIPHQEFSDKDIENYLLDKSSSKKIQNDLTNTYVLCSVNNYGKGYIFIKNKSHLSFQFQQSIYLYKGETEFISIETGEILLLKDIRFSFIYNQGSFIFLDSMVENGIRQRITSILNSQKKLQNFIQEKLG